MRYLLYSLMVLGGFTSYSQEKPVVTQSVENGVITQKTTSGNKTVVTKQRESKLTIQQLSRPERVTKEIILEEEKEKKKNPTQ